MQEVMDAVFPPDLREEAVCVVEIWLGEDRIDDESRTNVLLEAAGVLSLLGDGGRVEALAAPYRIQLEARVAEAISSFEPEVLDLVIDRVLELAPELALAEGGVLADLEEEVVRLLLTRDSIELALEGASLLLGHKPSIPAELAAAIAGFDRRLEPELWRLVPLGSRREAMCAWAEPSRRAQLWWWHRGSSLPHTALAELASSAWLIHVFPEARAEFERLIEAEDVMRDAVKEIAALAESSSS